MQFWPILTILAVGLLPAACAPQKPSPEELCLAMSAGDVAVHENLKESMLGRYQYCRCFGAHVDVLESDERSVIQSVLQTVIDIRAATDLGVTDAADLVFADEDGTTYGVTNEDIEFTWKLLGGLQDDMSVMSGACPTPSRAGL